MKKRDKLVAGGALLITLLCFLATVAQVHAETYSIEVYSIYNQTEEGFHTLLYATCLDSTNTSQRDNITFTINTAEFTYSNETGRYQATYSRGTPGVETFGGLDSFTDTANVTSTATVTRNATVTWTQGTIERLQTDFMTGDWINAILGEYTYTMGSLYFWTTIMTILSVGIYNVGGVYVTLFSWITGWSVFSGVVHGQAQVIGYMFIMIGFGLAIVKLMLDRRTS